MAVRKIRVCPKCGSDKIRAAKSSVSGWLVPTTYYSEEEDCDYCVVVWREKCNCRWLGADWWRSVTYVGICYC